MPRRALASRIERADATSRGGLRAFSLSSPELRGADRVVVTAALPYGIRDDIRGHLGGVATLASSHSVSGLGAFDGVSLSHDACLYSEEEVIAADGAHGAATRAVARLWARLSRRTSVAEAAEGHARVLSAGAELRALSRVRAANGAHRAFFERRRELGAEWPTPPAHLSVVAPPDADAWERLSRWTNPTAATLAIAGGVLPSEGLDVLRRSGFWTWRMEGARTRIPKRGPGDPTDTARSVYASPDSAGPPVLGLAVPFRGRESPSGAVGDLLGRLPCPFALDFYAHEGTSVLVAWGEVRPAATRGGIDDALELVSWLDHLRAGARLDWTEAAAKLLRADTLRLEAYPAGALRVHLSHVGIAEEGAFAPFGTAAAWGPRQAMREVLDALHPAHRPRLFALGAGFDLPRLAQVL